MLALAARHLRFTRRSPAGSRRAPLRLQADRRGLSTLEYALLFVTILVGALAVWKKLAASMDAQVLDGIDQFARMTSQNVPSSASSASFRAASSASTQASRVVGDAQPVSEVQAESNRVGQLSGISDLDPPILQKKHEATTKPDADDAGTYDLWLTCRDGVTQACTTLEQTNAAQLKEVLPFIQRVAPDLYDAKNPPKFEWDSSEKFFNDNDGATQGNTITLARGYYSERALVNTVAHELQHAQQSPADVWLTWGQDKMSEIMGDGNMGAKHQAIADRALEIEGMWVEEHQ